MAAELFSPPSRALDANASPYSGATWTFYATGTTTPQPVFAEADLSPSLGSVVTADAGGKFPNIYLDSSLVYRGVCKNADASVTLHDIDPINFDFLDFLDANAVIKDEDGHVGLGTASASDAVLSIETESAAGLQRAIAIDHNDPSLGSWAIDVHLNEGGYGIFGGHCYSSRNGDIAGAVAVKLDHTRHGSILALSNARNQVTSPGTTGTADFIVGAGFPDTSVSLATNPVVLFQWTYQNIILTPQTAWPLTITGSGLVVNALSTSPRGLVVNQGATGIYGSIVSGVNYGSAVSTTANGGQTLTITKNGTGNGSAVVVVNEGTDPSLVGLKGGVQGFAIYPDGDIYHGSTKVIGAQGALVANAVNAAGSPTQSEFNAFVTQFNALLARLRAHGLIAT